MGMPRIAIRSFFTALAALLALAAVASPTVAAPLKPGIDISYWQNNVRWDKVGATNVQFIIARASHGTVADEKYAEYRIGAAEEGIPLGAYHYAEPRGGMRDAVEQADFFLAMAAPTTGDILPVLDIEQTNGKGPTALTKWVTAWLNRVENKSGLKPMIYTSPAFWETALGNTKKFAKRGHKLWVANWDVSKPAVPASNWAGHGWTFWQWTNCRSVEGINGCVDGDRYVRANLGKVKIR